MAQSQKLHRDEIIRGLTEINDYLAGKDLSGEICIYGGACMCLAFSSRLSTKDVDAVFQPADAMRKAIFEVGKRNGWKWNWINDDVAGFLSKTPVEYTELAELEQLAHLKVLFPPPQYMLAMKCLAGRTGSEEDPSPDLGDAVWLCQQIHMQKASEISEVVKTYYPDEALSENTRFFIHEVAAHLESCPKRR